MAGLGDPWEEFRHVAVRRRRHAERKPVTSSIRAVTAAGRRAARRGVPRYANPYEHRVGRAWRWAWDTAHGACDGCAACLVGCTPPTLPLFVALERRPVDMIAAVFGRDERRDY